MPTQSTRAAMAVGAFRGGGRSQIAYFDSGGNGLGKPLKPAGLQVGDIAILIALTPSGVPYVQTNVSLEDWPVMNFDQGYVFYKVLNAADIANTWNAGGSSAFAAEYYRPPAAVIIEPVQVAKGNGAIVLTGVSSSGSRGIISIYGWQQSVGVAAPVGTKPTNFTQRSIAIGSQWRYISADSITGKYQGSPVVWNNVPLTQGSGYAFLLKIR